MLQLIANQRRGAYFFYRLLFPIFANRRRLNTRELIKIENDKIITDHKVNVKICVLLLLSSITIGPLTFILNNSNKIFCP